MQSKGSVLGGSLLICGITIGVGMLGLPVATAQAGFFPALALYLACWLFMLSTGLLVLEACLHAPLDANFSRMSLHLLGRSASSLCWLLYLFLLSCLMIAHYAGAGIIIQKWSGGIVSYKAAVILFVFFLWPLIFAGTRLIDRFNALLMTLLVLSFLLFFAFSIQHVHIDFLASANWRQALGAVPVVFTAFGFQTLIPTLYRYLGRDYRKTKQSILFGSFLPFLIYAIWQFLISGIVPIEALQAAKEQGISAVAPLSAVLAHPWIYAFSNAFAAITLVASYLGISIGFIDFLADGLKMGSQKTHRFLLCCLIFLPPAAVSLYSPGIFLRALGLAGGIGCALLNAALPVAMVYNARRRDKAGYIPTLLPFGKGLLFLLFSLSLLVVFLEFF